MSSCRRSVLKISRLNGLFPPFLSDDYRYLGIGTTDFDCRRRTPPDRVNRVTKRGQKMEGEDEQEFGDPSGRAAVGNVGRAREPPAKLECVVEPFGLSVSLSCRARFRRMTPLVSRFTASPSRVEHRRPPAWPAVGSKPVDAPARYALELSPSRQARPLPFGRTPDHSRAFPVAGVP